MRISTRTHARAVLRLLAWDRADLGLLVALALGLMAAWPFLAQPGLPRQTDAELHVFRAAQIAQLVRSGVLYSRWAPDLYLGYGYPIFNYYAPLTYYLANLFNLLPGVDVVNGVRAVFVLGLVLAAIGTYKLARRYWGAGPALLAAACFAFSPYVVFIDPHARGDLAEHFAICLLPASLYLFSRVVSREGGRAAFAGSVLALAALILSHNLLGLVGAGVLATYWLWQALIARRDRVALGWGALVFPVAAALTAFFWLPALLEWSAVELNVTGPGHFDYHQHFVDLGDLLAPARVLDHGAAAPRFRFGVGMPQWVLALSGTYAIVQRRFRRSALYFALGALVLTFLITSPSEFIWDAIPLLAFFQFPWRLLGPAALMVAICVGTGAAALPLKRGRPAFLGLALASVLGFALPLLYPPPWAPEFGGTAPRDIIAWETWSLAYGTTSTGDFVPKGAALVPMRPVETLVASYQGEGPIDKVNRATIPDGASVEILEHGPLHDRFWVSTPTKMILRLYTFHFPGWRAYVDGEATEIEIAHPEGFITVRVPAGEHEVLVRFEDTPARSVGWAVSAFGGAALLGILVGHPKWRSLTRPGWRRRRAHSDRRSLWWLAGVTLAFGLTKGLVIDRQPGWMRYTSPPGEALPAPYRVHANLGGQIELVGYELPRRVVRAGESFELVLYWRALVPLSENYQSFVHVARPLQALWGPEAHLPPGGLPTSRWVLDRYTWDAYRVPVLPGTPPGEYAVNVGLYLLGTGQRLPALDAGGQVIGDSVVLGNVVVQRPRQPPRHEALGMTQAVTATYPTAGVTLLGCAQDPKAVKLPGAWRITLFWRADRDHPSALSRTLMLFDEGGKEVWRATADPGGYPFGEWLAGDVIRDPVILELPHATSLPKGWYTFAVALNGETALATETGLAQVELGRVKFRPAEDGSGE